MKELKCCSVVRKCIQFIKQTITKTEMFRPKQKETKNAGLISNQMEFFDLTTITEHLAENKNTSSVCMCGCVCVCKKSRNV